MLEIKDQTGALEHIIYDDPRGMRHYNQSFLHDIHELMEMGRIHDRNHPDFLNTEIELGHYDDISVMLYTSGTTGKPKGVCQTHASLIAAAQGGVGFDGSRPGRRGALLPADGLGRRSPLLLRAGARRGLLRELPRSARP
jgi:long-subunit acyl-CoA synthetase (AMP-forming)